MQCKASWASVDWWHPIPSSHEIPNGKNHSTQTIHCLSETNITRITKSGIEGQAIQ